MRKNAIVVLIPRFGLEGTVFFDTKDKSAPNLVFDEEVSRFEVWFLEHQGADRSPAVFRAPL